MTAEAREGELRCERRATAGGRPTTHDCPTRKQGISRLAYPQKAAAWKLPTLRLAVLNRSCLSFLGWPQRRRRYVCACASACVRAVRVWPGSTMIKICSILLMARGVCPMMIFAGGA